MPSFFSSAATDQAKKQSYFYVFFLTGFKYYCEFSEVRVFTCVVKRRVQVWQPRCLARKWDLVDESQIYVTSYKFIIRRLIL